MSIQLREHPPGGNLDDFVDVASLLYTGDPGFVMPLRMEVRDRTDPGKNPFFEHGEASFFTAYRDGRPVGRISAQIDHLHAEHHGPGTGFFGFFDTVNDQEVASALVEAAASWLAARGMERMVGPFCLSINEELGTQVEGHAERPMMMTPYARPYQDELAQGCGLAKAKDVLFWRYDVDQVPERPKRALEKLRQVPELRFRSVRKSHIAEDVGIIMDIFNEAWADNWHFVPLTRKELRKMAEDLKLVLDERLAFIAEIEGQPAGMCVALPNICEPLAGCDGRLFPLGLPRLLWGLKVRRPSSARVILLGLKQEFRTRRRYAGLDLAIAAELAERGVELGYRHAELGWTLEDNRLINVNIRRMGGKPYKRHRLYEKTIGKGG